MKRLIIFLTLFFIEGCKVEDNTQLLCKPSSSIETNGEYHYYFIESNDYPLIYAIVNGKIMKGEKVRDYLSSIPDSSPLSGKDEYYWHYRSGDEYIGVSFIFPLREFLLKIHIWSDGGDFKIYKVDEETEKIIERFKSHSSTCWISEGGCDTYWDILGEKCYSDTGCVFGKGNGFFYLDEFTSSHPECIPKWMENIEVEKVFSYLCWKGGFSYNDKFYPDGMTLPHNTEYNGRKGKFWLSLEKRYTDYDRTTSHTFLWESILNETIILGVVSIGIVSDYNEYIENLDIKPHIVGPTYTSHKEIFVIFPYFIIKGESPQMINSTCNVFDCEEEERIDRCIYRALKIDDLSSCLKDGAERIMEDGTLLPLFYNHRMDCSLAIRRTYLSPPISCSPGYPSPLTD